MQTLNPLHFLDKRLYRFLMAVLLGGIILAGLFLVLQYPQPAQADTELPPIRSEVIAATSQISATIPTGYFPKGVAVNPVTNKIYVANNGGANVTVIDGDTYSTTTVAAGVWPWTLAVNPITNKIYVANNDDHSVTVIDGATNETATVPIWAGEPYAIAVNPVTNKIYVANENGHHATRKIHFTV